MSIRCSVRALVFAALLPLCAHALGAAEPPATMITVQAPTDLIAALKCLRAGYPFMTRLDADHAVCLLSTAGIERPVIRVRDVIDQAVRRVRGTP